DRVFHGAGERHTCARALLLRASLEIDQAQAGIDDRLRERLALLLSDVLLDQVADELREKTDDTWSPGEADPELERGQDRWQEVLHQRLGCLARAGAGDAARELLARAVELVEMIAVELLAGGDRLGESDLPLHVVAREQQRGDLHVELLLDD